MNKQKKDNLIGMTAGLVVLGVLGAGYYFLGAIEKSNIKIRENINTLTQRYDLDKNNKLDAEESNNLLKSIGYQDKPIEFPIANIKFYRNFFGFGEGKGFNLYKEDEKYYLRISENKLENLVSQE